MSKTEDLFELECPAMSYAWGKVGKSSIVASLLAKGLDARIEANKPYAELWMGTHPNAPAYIVGTNKSLEEYVKEAPIELLGERLAAIYDNKLPFLFKVLSVATALSIQAHPDKKLAGKLHDEQPDVYKDPNHKPEMVIALTEFEALIGFRSLQELLAVFNEQVPEISALVGNDEVATFTSAAKTLPNGLPPGFRLEGPIKLQFKRILELLLTKPQEEIKKALDEFIYRTAKYVNSSRRIALVHRLNEQYPGDVGCFMSFFFNYVTLMPGQGSYLLENEPHAYLSGDCVECMASSDNVVRCGLTPKLKDVPVLINMLTYSTVNPKEAIVNGNEIFLEGSLNSKAYLYRPPIAEFKVIKLEIGKNGVAQLPTLFGPSIILVVEPKHDTVTLKSEYSTQKTATRGSVYFMKPRVKSLRISFQSKFDDKAIIYIAYCNID